MGEVDTKMKEMSKPDTSAEELAIKSPRQFRNALYQHLTSHGVSDITATTICDEAEIYLNGYTQYQLRDIEYAARAMGLRLTKEKK